MNVTRPLLVFAASASLTWFSVACGGKEDTSATSASQTAGTGEDAPESSGARSGSSEETATPAPSSTSASASSCVYRSSGGSSGGGGPDGAISCGAIDEYTCADGDKTIECDCTGHVGQAWDPGTCACGDLTFAFDCANGCSIGAAEYDKCGLPAPPSDPGGGGSSSSSSTGGP